MALLGVLLEVGGLLGFTWWLLGKYKDKNVRGSVHSAVFVSWVLGFMGLLLLPMDIARNGVDRARGKAHAEYHHGTYVSVWHVLYWSTLLMCWCVLPFLNEYCQNGEFAVDKRVVSSIKRLVFHWTILVMIAGAVLLYLVLINHFTFKGLIGLAMASANTYGLLWLIALLGYGLVDIPRSFWTLRYPENRLQELYFRAVQVHEERMEAVFLYEDAVKDAHECFDRMRNAESAAIILTSDMQYVRTCILQVLELVEGSGTAQSTHVRKTMRHSHGMLSMTAPSLNEVVDLNRRLKSAKFNLRRCEQAWIDLCIQADTLLDRANQRDVPAACLYPVTSALNRVRNGWILLRHHTYRLLTPPISICCALITGLASVCVLWSELTMGWSDKLSLMHNLLTAQSLDSGVVELVTVTLLLYLVVCAYSSLFKLRFFGKYALRGHQNSTELCLLKTSIYQCRLQFSLGYNFLLLLNQPNVTDSTAFHALFQNMMTVEFLGQNFSVYAPILMVLLVAFTLTNGYAHLMKQIGLDQYEQVILTLPEHQHKITKGEQLVQKGLDKYQSVINRRKKQHENDASVYGFSASTKIAQALLPSDSGDTSNVAPNRTSVVNERIA